MTEALQLEIRTLRALLDSERDPGGRAFAPLADAYRRAGQIPEALRLLRDGIAKHPEFVTGHVVAARLYVEQGLTAEGAIAARRALQLDGENVHALRSLLRALDESGDREEAEGVRSVLTTLEPDFVPDWGAPAVEEAHAQSRTAQEDHAAPAPILELRSMEPETSPEVSADLSLEEPRGLGSAGAAPGGGGGMIDITTLGALPVADVTLSALAPELPSPDASDAGLDVGLAGFELSLEEDRGDAASAVESTPEEPVLDLGSLAPEAADEEPVKDLPMPAPEISDEEPLTELSLLAPDDDEPVMDLALLAPDAADEEPVTDLAMLAPDPADDEPVMDLALLAPDPADDEPVMDLALLAPEASDEEPTTDLPLLAPEGTDADALLDVASLAPEEERLPDLERHRAPDDMGHARTGATGVVSSERGGDNGQMSAVEAAEVGFAAPDESDERVVDLDVLRAEHTAVSSGPPPADPLEMEVAAAGPLKTDEDAGSAEPPFATKPTPGADEETDVPADDQGEPIFTRTLAELYAAQGAVKEAITVLKHLLEESPQDERLTRRIAELEAGGTSRSARAEEAERTSKEAERTSKEAERTSKEAEADDHEVETLARDLAESGRRPKEVHSPFAWTERESASTAPPEGPTIREYFDGLLNWEPRDS